MRMHQQYETCEPKEQSKRYKTDRDGAAWM